MPPIKVGNHGFFIVDVIACDQRNWIIILFSIFEYDQHESHKIRARAGQLNVVIPLITRLDTRMYPIFI